MQRKQARTGEEREEEEEEQISESESEDEENEIIYNPKNLPLGWDGKVTETIRPGEVGEISDSMLLLYLSFFAMQANPHVSLLAAHPILVV